MTDELKSGLGPDWTPLLDALMNDSNSSGAKKLHDALEVSCMTKLVLQIWCLKKNFKEV